MINDECLIKLHDFYADNKSAFGDDLDSLDTITQGILGGCFVRSMETFDDFMHSALPSLVARAGAMGHDVSIANYNGQREELITPGFNINRHYFYFDDRGNLVSTDIRDCDPYLTKKNLSYIVELASHHGEFYKNLSNGAKEIVDNYI